MFPQSARLTQKRLFDTLFKRGTWVRGKLFSLIYLPRERDGKIGFIITKKVAKSAVARNQIKRRLRSAFLEALHEPSLETLRQHYNLVIVIHRANSEVTFAQLVEEVKTKLRKLAKPPSSRTSKEA